MKLIDERLAAQLMPQLDPEANKYTRGVCELVVGDSLYPGAAVLATLAATRMGTGYVKVYTSEQAELALHILQPSAVVSSFNRYDAEPHTCDNHHPRATVIGCGLSAREENSALTLRVIAAAQVPLLLDGGALNTIATKEGFEALAEHRRAGYAAIITPHGGEAARLLKALPHLIDEEEHPSASAEGASMESTEPAEPTAAHDALRLAHAYNVICVLKGPRTYIATPEDNIESVRVFEGGSPALAKAGTGDVLAGCIGALLSQSLSPVDAAVLGVSIHGKAGVLAARDIGEFGVTTEDVIKMLPQAARPFSKIQGAEA